MVRFPYQQYSSLIFLFRLVVLFFIVRLETCAKTEQLVTVACGGRHADRHLTSGPAGTTWAEPLHENGADHSGKRHTADQTNTV